MVGFTCCGEMGELTPPDNCAVPSATVIACPPTTTFASTGEGGSPPPTKIEDRAASAPISPDALNRFTQYPRASPSEVEHVPSAAGIARCLDKAPCPATMMAELT